MTAENPVAESGPMGPDDFDQFDSLLDDIRTRFDETPQWEFCDGFMAALICCRRVIPASEYLPVLLDTESANEKGQHAFADDAQFGQFMALWARRWNEIAEALNRPVDNIGEDGAYHPEVMDVRGAVARLPPEEREAVPAEELPAYGQVWAIGFMFAVETWPEEWQPVRDKKTAKAIDAALDVIVVLTEDDNEPPTIAVADDDGPPSVSENRLGAFADAIWAVYDLRELWRNFGPRIETVVKPAAPGRNAPCFCGSGKKYKKCHGA